MTYAYERVDCHTHSAYSGHGSGSVADMVRRAEDLGLSTFAQTEHLVLPDGMDPLFETSMSSQTMKRYVDELHEQRERLAHAGSGMQLLCGIEADWLPGRTAELERLCAPFDYVLGSVHFIDNRPIDDSRDLNVWDDYGIDGLWRAYFESWLDMAAHPGPIMCFAHPDLPKKYGWHPSFDAREYNYEMAQAVARSGRMVEVNTAGLRKDPRSRCSAPFATRASSARLAATRMRQRTSRRTSTMPSGSCARRGMGSSPCRCPMVTGAISRSKTRTGRDNGGSADDRRT